MARCGSGVKSLREPISACLIYLRKCVSKGLLLLTFGRTRRTRDDMCTFINHGFHHSFTITRNGEASDSPESRITIPLLGEI